MISVTPQMRVFVAIEPADFRKGIDGLARLCRQQLKISPFSGAVFVSRNRRRTALKILCYDSQGFWLCYKRFSSSKLAYWPKPGDGPAAVLRAHELHVLLSGGNPTGIKAAPEWRSVATSHNR